MVRNRGLFDEIPHVRLIRGVIIVRTEDAGKVLELLHALRAEVHRRQVELTEEDEQRLGFLTGD